MSCACLLALNRAHGTLVDVFSVPALAPMMFVLRHTSADARRVGIEEFIGSRSGLAMSVR